MLIQRRHFNALCLGAAAMGLGSPALAQKSPPVVLVVGDSLSAEYGLVRGQGWVALLEQRLKSLRSRLQVVNASISGDTTSGGRSRLPTLLRTHKPSVVVIELGGNDALRGLPLDVSRANLQAMIEASQQAGAKVLLVGMEMPPNYGARYAEQFRQLYVDLARQKRVPLVPFFLKGIADRTDAMDFFQADRIHPNEAAQPKMLDNVWPALQPLLPRS
jgi:acyl-CoA thioesterase-1